WQDLYCVQLSETRWALAALLSDNGRLFVTVNTHLHHAFEMKPEYQTQFRDLSEDLLDSLKRGNQRRELEIRTLIQHLENQKLFRYPILLSGDFNATPEASCLERLKEKGFID